MDINKMKDLLNWEIGLLEYAEKSLGQLDATNVARLEYLKEAVRTWEELDDKIAKIELKLENLK